MPSKSLLLVTLLVAPLVTRAQAPTEIDQEPIREEGPFGHLERLEAGVRLYQTGKAERAAAMFAALVNDPSLNQPDLRQQARLYLGEVHYSQQNQEEARRLFEAVLMVDPNFVMDPFAHPPDVTGFFETIRAYIRPTTPPPPQITDSAPVPKTPASAFYGFGIYQLSHGDKRMGTTLAIGQSVFAIVSIASFAGLLGNHAWATKDERSRLQTQKIVQWSSTAGFYGLWVWSAVDAKRHWRANVNLAHGGIPLDNRQPQFHLGLTIPTQ